MVESFWLHCLYNDHARGKLGLKLLKCTFIGYKGDEFGYRL